MRSSPAKEDKQNDSEFETLHLPGIRPQSVASSIKSPYFSSVKVVKPKGELGGHIEILTEQDQLINRTRKCNNSFFALNMPHRHAIERGNRQQVSRQALERLLLTGV